MKEYVLQGGSVKATMANSIAPLYWGRLRDLCEFSSDGAMYYVKLGNGNHLVLSDYQFKMLFDSADEIEIFSKKAIYLYLRELTGMNTKQIVQNSLLPKLLIWKQIWTIEDQKKLQDHGINWCWSHAPIHWMQIG